jgi:hypothetical protein
MNNEKLRDLFSVAIDLDSVHGRDTTVQGTVFKSYCRAGNWNFYASGPDMLQPRSTTSTTAASGRCSSH